MATTSQQTKTKEGLLKSCDEQRKCDQFVLSSQTTNIQESLLQGCRLSKHVCWHQVVFVCVLLSQHDFMYVISINQMSQKYYEKTTPYFINESGSLLSSQKCCVNKTLQHGWPIVFLNSAMTLMASQCDKGKPLEIFKLQPITAQTIKISTIYSKAQKV